MSWKEDGDASAGATFGVYSRGMDNSDTAEVEPGFASLVRLPVGFL